MLWLEQVDALAERLCVCNVDTGWRRDYRGPSTTMAILTLLPTTKPARQASTFRSIGLTCSPSRAGQRIGVQRRAATCRAAR